MTHLIGRLPVLGLLGICIYFPLGACRTLSNNVEAVEPAESLSEQFSPETFRNAVPVREKPYGKTIGSIQVGSTVNEGGAQSEHKQIQTIGWVLEENLDCHSGSCVIVK